MDDDELTPADRAKRRWDQQFREHLEAARAALAAARKPQDVLTEDQ